MSLNRRHFLALSSLGAVGVCLSKPESARAARALGDGIKATFGFVAGSQDVDSPAAHRAELLASTARLLAPECVHGELLGQQALLVTFSAVPGSLHGEISAALGYLPYHQQRTILAALGANPTLPTQARVPMSWSHGLQLHFEAQHGELETRWPVTLGAHASADAPLHKGAYLMRFEKDGALLGEVFLTVEPAPETV